MNSKNLGLISALLGFITLIIGFFKSDADQKEMERTMVKTIEKEVSRRLDKN